MGENFQTFALIKPDAVERSLTGVILERIESAKFCIDAVRSVILTQALLEEFYIEHKEKSFFAEMVDFMKGKMAVALILKRDDAVLKFRELLGATNPAAAAVGSIRHDFGLSIDANSVHGSDSVDSAKREIGIFFG